MARVELLALVPLMMATAQSFFTSDSIWGTVVDLDGDGIDEYLIRGPRGREVRSGRDDRSLDWWDCWEVQLAGPPRPVFSVESDTHSRRRFGIAPPEVPGDVAMIVPWSPRGPSDTQRFVHRIAINSLLWVDLNRVRSMVPIATPSLDARHPRGFQHVDDAWVDDLDRDGVDDVIFHVELEDERAESGVIAACGRTGKHLWRLRLPGMDTTFEYTIPGCFAFVTPGDLDVDGVVDLVFAEVKHAFSGGTAVYAVSATSGAVLWRQDDAGRLDETLGQTVVLVSDRDGDGFRDLACAQGDPTGSSRSEILVLSSGTGQVLSRFRL